MVDNKYGNGAVNSVEEVTKAAKEDVKFDDNQIVEELGVISKNTKIIGDITTSGHLAIYGEVEGNITAKGNIFANGMIRGDISCDNLKLSNCDLKTNLNVMHSVNIGGDTKVSGTIICGKIVIDGTVKGDITASEAVDIFANAKVEGNISTKSLAIESGAELEGKVSVVK